MPSLDARQLVPIVLCGARNRHLLWPLWWAGLAVATVALASGVMSWRTQGGEAAALRAELNELTSQAVSAVASIKPSPQQVDFTAALPHTAPTDKLLREAFKTAARAGVTVVSAEPQDASLAATNAVLPYAALSLRLVGPYVGIKGVSGELLARFPGLTVQQLRIQRGSGNAAGGTQEATLTLQQWLRPRPASQPSTETRG